MALGELRAARRHLQQQEADLSYLRRLLQGRIDILRAELADRRQAQEAAARQAAAQQAAGGAGERAESGPGGPGEQRAGYGPTRSGTGDVLFGDHVLRRLPQILADAPSPVRSSARHVTLRTPGDGEYLDRLHAVLGDVALSDLHARSEAELGRALERLAAQEHRVSTRRQQLQRMVDGCSREITRRYRDGEARVEDLLAPG
nr:ABC transporter permease [Allostreptomyces psammosilenae]